MASIGEAGEKNGTISENLFNENMLRYGLNHTVKFHSQCQSQSLDLGSSDNIVDELSNHLKFLASYPSDTFVVTRMQIET